MSSSESQSGQWSMGSPHNSFEPFFASLAAMNPQANFDKTDVIARANDLQQLTGFARGNMNNYGVGNVALGFQFQVVNNTLLIQKLLNTRWGGQTLGRGMTPTLQGSFFNKITQMNHSHRHVSPDHYQAMRYDLGPLHLVAITPVDAATGEETLPPTNISDTSSLMPKGPGFVDIRQGGRGVAPIAVAHIHTSVTNRPGTAQAVSARGNLRLLPAKMFKLWLQRPASVVQGHLERDPQSSSSSDETARLTRISVRDTKHIFGTIEDIRQIEFRKLPVLLNRLRETAIEAGGPCIITYQPSKKTRPGGPVEVPSRFEIYKCNPEAPPIVLDWHVKKFWSRY